MFQVNFDSYEGILKQVECRHILGLDEKDSALVKLKFI